ncbi:MAG: glycosyltransferase family 2 protein [Candidatus Levyibacteriota bacterium]
MKTKVVIIILNWNGVEDTQKCVESVLKIDFTDYKILVVDNGSEKDEVSILKNKFGKKIEVLALPQNVGFTGGMNAGIQYVQKYNPEFFLLLNNDTEVTKHFLSQLIQTAATNPTIGILSPTIYNYDDHNKIIFSGGYINWLFGKTYHKTDRANEIRICNFITGCCLLIKSEVIKKVGLFDERFFAYFEDAAYSLAAKKAGFACACDPDSIIYHKEGASMEKTGPFKTYLIARNRILFVKYYAPFFVKYYFAIFNIFKLFFASIYFTLTGQAARARTFFKGYIDGTFGGGGMPTI